MLNIFHFSTITWSLIEIVVFSLAAFFMFLLGYLTRKSDSIIFDKKSKKISRSVLGGLFSEQVAPFLPDFPTDLKASEARFIGKPIDFVVFRGMDEQNIEEVVFVEVKSGRSQLSINERKLKDAIDNKRVRWHEYRIPEEVSNLQERIEPLLVPVV